MKLTDWNKTIDYVKHMCGMYPDIRWTTYSMYDGRKGIRLFTVDSSGDIYEYYYTGICDSFDEMKSSIQYQIARLMGE